MTWSLTYRWSDLRFPVTGGSIYNGADSESTRRLDSDPTSLWTLCLLTICVTFGVDRMTVHRNLT